MWKLFYLIWRSNSNEMSCQVTVFYVLWPYHVLTVNLEGTGFSRTHLRNANTVKILCIGTDRSHQTVQTKIRLLLKKQSDQGLRCLPFHPHLLDALMQCYVKLFFF